MDSSRDRQSKEEGEGAAADSIAKKGLGLGRMPPTVVHNT